MFYLFIFVLVKYKEKENFLRNKFSSSHVCEA